MTEDDKALSPPPLHLLKMAVGISDLDDLRRVSAARIAQLGGSFAPEWHDPAPLHATARHAPPQAAAWSATSRPIAPLLKPPRA